MIFSPLQTIRRLLMKVEISNGWLTADVRTTSQLSLLHNIFNELNNEIFWINICFCFCSLVSLKAGRLINGILETKVALVLVYNDGVFEINHYWWQITTRRPITSAQPWVLDLADEREIAATAGWRSSHALSGLQFPLWSVWNRVSRQCELSECNFSIFGCCPAPAVVKSHFVASYLNLLRANALGTIMSFPIIAWGTNFYFFLIDVACHTMPK